MGQKDPFSPSPWIERPVPQPSPAAAITDCRDPQRPRQELERYSLGSLTLAGSFRAPGDGALWALVEAPDGIVHRLGEDHYLGLNHGRVVQVGERRLDVLECVADPQGGWEER